MGTKAVIRAAIGSISGSSAPRADNRPNMRGALTVERDLPAGTKLWLAAWSKQISGASYISISAEVAVGGPRKRGGQGDSLRSGPMTGRAQGALVRNLREDDAEVRRAGWPTRGRPTASDRRQG